MYSRPKPSETDEDLLEMQAVFNKDLAANKIKLAATLVTDTAAQVQEPPELANIRDDIDEHLTNTFESIPTNINIGKIIENRKIEDNIMHKFKFNKHTGFPQAKRRDVSIRNGSSSIFSQQFLKSKKPLEMKEPIINGSSSKKIKMDVKPHMTERNISSHSSILSAADRQSVHTENVNVLQTMSESEIMEERERLLSTMDPAIVAYLKSRKKEEPIENCIPTIHQQNQAGYDMNIEEINAITEILHQPNSEKWLHFNSIETNKLAWMKNVEYCKINKDESMEARFDFNGWLLPSSGIEINEENRILYHHGEEPDRPGYTLQELFTLARSAVNQQKIIALNTIANLLSLYSTGIYQDVIEIPIEQLFFLLRFCLDDNSPAVLNASIKAMRNLVHNQIDEVCLDCLLNFGCGLVQPVLCVDNDKEDDNTINDQQLAETNLIKCLVRTGIFTRIRYVINTLKPQLETIIYCLDILLRLVRDSEYVVEELYKSDGLIQCIVENFIPKEYYASASNSAYGLPVLQAVKLVRVLSARNVDIAKDLDKRFNIMECISKYLYDEQFLANANGLRLQTECFHLWSTWISYNLGCEYLRYLEPALLRNLVYHSQNTNVDTNTTFVKEGHCSGLLVLLSTICRIKNAPKPSFETLINPCFSKWCTQFGNLQSFECGKLQLISSLFKFGSAIYGLTNLSKIINGILLNVINSDGFSVVTQNIELGSMLLNNYEPHPYSANLKTIQASSWYTSEHVVPLIKSNSCIPFLTALSEYILTTKDYKLKWAFMKNSNLVTYINSLKNMEKYFLINHWFTRIESQLIINILKLSIELQTDLDTSVFYDLAVKSLYIFNSEQKSDVDFLLRDIIFCSNFYPSETLLKNLNINQRNQSLEVSLNNLHEIHDVYAEVLGLNTNIEPVSNLSLDIGIGNILPVDWIYTPIISLYTCQHEKKIQMDEGRQIFIVKNCLRWILIFESYFPSLTSIINPTDRFCRLACIFLGSDNLFLNEDIHELLELCLKNIISNCEGKLNFDKPIEGLNNFQDFYTQLLEQYQGVSYGDILFGNFILVPLAQKQNVQWRKTLWSEYIGVVETMNVSTENMISTLDNFLNPAEEDLSLLKCYHTALMRNIIRKSSALYAIALHHDKQCN